MAPEHSTSDIGAALSNLRACLHTINAVGEAGFEGLMRDLMTDLTKMPFRLSKSGPQGGVDLRSQAANALQVGLEAKQYASSTYLGLDDLKAKIYDAAGQAEPVDVWVLAASRPISDTDARSLKSTGETFGIAVVVIDWTESLVTVPRMAVLCASAPVLCAAFLGGPPGLEDDLRAIAGHPSFPDQLKYLREDLTSADLGFASALTTIQNWMEDAQSSEAKARSRLQGPNNLTEAGVALVKRTEIFTGLDGWWRNKDALVAALIGQEGNGKTWVSLDWSHALGTGCQLTVFLPARDIGSLRLPEAIAEALAKRTKLRNVAFWLKRLELWSGAVHSTLPILVIIDGIDQNWVCDWPNTIQPLLDPAIGGLFRVVLTCRPDPWADLGGLASLYPVPQKIDVPRLSDPELADLLKCAGLERADFAPAVLELMRTPRLSLLAIQQRDALAASGDVTAERLIYEDWKHRLGRRHFGVSDAAFQTFIERLGRELRDTKDTFTITRKQLLDRLSEDSGQGHDVLRTALSEIVDGRWLDKDPTNEHIFKVEKALVPYALGLALAADLRGALDTAEAENRIAEYLDPLSGQSLALAVLRACATVVLLDGQVARASRYGIIDRWVSEQNFSRQDFDALWRLAGLDLDLFCDYIEDNWLEPRGGIFRDEILIKSMANAYEFPEVAPRLQARVAKWLGWAWPDPFDGMFIGQHDLTTPESQAKQKVTRDNLAWWQKHAGTSSTWPTIALKEAGHVSWFSHRVLGIISYLKRAPFIEALVAWALSRSVMDFPRHFEELAWLLRLNRKDPVDARAAIIAAVARLTEDGSVIGRRGASWLLDGLGDEAAGAVAATIRKQVAKDTGEEERTSAQRHHLYDGFGPIAPHEQVVWDRQSSKMPVGAKLWLYPREQGQDEVLLSMNSSRIARTDPAFFRSLAEEAAQSASGRADEELLGLARRAARFIFLLTPPFRQGLRQVLLDRYPSMKDEAIRTELAGIAQFIALWGQPAMEQVAILSASMPQGIYGVWKKVFNRIADADWPLVRAHADAAADTEILRSWMQYLHIIVTAEQAENWPGLAAIVVHSDSMVRQCALELAFNGRNMAALDAWAKSGWSPRPGLERKELIYGSLSLVLAEIELGRNDNISQMEREALGFALVQQPQDGARLDAFETFFKAEMDALFKPGARTIPQYWHDHVLALEALFKARKSSLVPWLSKWMDNHAELAHPAMFDNFPLISLCRVLLDVDPASGVRLWRLLKKRMEEGMVKRDDLCLLPVMASDSPEVEAARSEALSELDKDVDIFNFAITAQNHERTSWLTGEIRRRLTLEEPVERALAYQLTGYLDSSPAADTLWLELNAPPISATWLADVYATAQRSYQKNQFARYWHLQFLQEIDVPAAYGALELCFSSVDARVSLWARAMFDVHRDTLGLDKQAHWRTNASRFDEEAKKSREDKKKKLLNGDIMDQTQAPWQ